MFSIIKTYTFSPLLLIVLLIFPVNSKAQETVANYTISHNGKTIGSMQFNQKINGEEVHLKLSSQVKARFVFEINANTLDQSYFKAGKLMWSNVFRTVNGKEKESKNTTFVDHSYQLISGKKIWEMNRPIQYNMALLYSIEPVHITSVYSDNFQQFLSIKKIAQNKYRIDLPDGNYNEYAFKDGRCNHIRVHQSLYTIDMKLTSIL